MRLSFGTNGSGIHGAFLWTLFAAMAGFLAYALVTGDWTIGEGFRENQAAEILQLLYLLAGALLFFIAAYGETVPVPRRLFTGLGLFLLTVLSREVEVERTWAEPYFLFIIEGDIHYAVLGVIWLGLIGASLRYVRAGFEAAWGWAKTRPGVFTLLGIALYLFTDATEKEVLIEGKNQSKMIEETIECVATYLFFASAYLNLTAQRLTARPAHTAPHPAGPLESRG